MDRKKIWELEQASSSTVGSEKKEGSAIVLYILCKLGWKIRDSGLALVMHA